MFLWWYHFSLLFHFPDGFALIFVHLKEQSPLLAFSFWFRWERLSLKVAVMPLAEWEAASLLAGRAQWPRLNAALLAEVSVGAD